MYVWKLVVEDVLGSSGVFFSKLFKTPEGAKKAAVKHNEGPIEWRVSQRQISSSYNSDRDYVMYTITKERVYA